MFLLQVQELQVLGVTKRSACGWTEGVRSVFLAFELSEQQDVLVRIHFLFSETPIKNKLGGEPLGS